MNEKMTTENRMVRYKHISVLSVIIKSIGVILRAAPIWVTCYIIVSLFYGLSFGLITLLKQRLFDCVAQELVIEKSIEVAVMPLILFAGVTVANQILNGLSNFLYHPFMTDVSKHLTFQINKKMNLIDVELFENAEILDDINKADTGKDYMARTVLTIITLLSYYIPYFIFMCFYLSELKPEFIVMLLILFLPVVMTHVVRMRIHSDLEDKSAIYRRKADYYESCLTEREYLKETRVLGATFFFLNRLKHAIQDMGRLKWKADVKANLVELSMKIITLVCYGIVLYMLVEALLKAQITVGAFGAVFTSISLMFELMEEVVYFHVGSIAKNVGSIRNYFRFMMLPERDDFCEGQEFSKDDYVTHGDIRLENVSYHYPLMDENAVKDVNLVIKKGETIAVVGENGSGKSTLMRLISGIYKPVKGSVIHENIDISKIPKNRLISGMTAVFQKFQRYQMTVEHNITISQMEEAADSRRVEQAVLEAGVNINSNDFPDGYKTMLSREFNGVDLSGGQWQRVAIARGLFRKHEIIILDEPTAAIDPMEETRLYKCFAEAAEDKTAIFVTHRMGAVKYADRVIVMEKGRIVGLGTHQSLLASCELYKQLWNVQAQYY